MALQQDTVSIDLAQGVNNKVDDKIAGPNQTSSLQNARFDKEGRLTKRSGLTTQGQTIQGGIASVNSVSFISSSTVLSKVFAHEDQLCVIQNGNLFSQYKAQDSWVFKGTYVPLSITPTRLDATIAFTDSVTVGSVTVASGGDTVYTVEEATGTLVGQSILTGGEKAVRLIGFSDTAWVLTNSSGSGSLIARQVSTQNGSVGSASILASDYVGYPYPPNLATTNSASALGEAAFIVYSTSSSDTSRLIPFSKNSGTISSGMSIMALGSISAFYNAITIEPSVNPNRFYVSGVGAAQAWNFGSTTYSIVWTSPFTPPFNGISSTSSQPHSVTLALSPTNNSDLYVFADYYTSSGLQYTLTQSPDDDTSNFSDDATLTMMQLAGAGGSILSNATYGRGYYLAGQAFRDTTRKTIYLPCVYTSPLQPTVFIMDALEGRPSRFNYTVGKTLYGRSKGFNPILTATTSVLSQTLPTSPGGDVYRFLNNSYFVDVDLTPSNPPQTQYFANTTHGTGGFLWAYDGINLSEHNFFLTPEKQEIVSASTSAIATMTAIGGSGSAQQVVFTFTPGNFMKSASGGTNWLGFDTTVQPYYIWYKIDGTGTDPAPGGGRLGLQVNISAIDTAADVAFKTYTTLNNTPLDHGTVEFGPASSNNSQIRITNTVGGPVASASVNGFVQSGPFTTGSYQYCAVWKYTDRNGKVYRSAPSVPITATINGSSSASFEVWAPPITNKSTNEVFVELYRTLNNGTTFYLLNSSSTWSQTASRIVYFDTTVDGSLSSRPILYTAGGVLDNYNIGACTAVSFFKERLTVTGVDNPHEVFYSKAVVNGEPVNFAAELSFNVDADQDAVTATGFMDDKLIVFKPNLVYALSGDGPNDLGEGSTLSQPQRIASEVGTEIPNSVILYPNGLMFKSSKGFYTLNRSLMTEYVGAPVQDFNDFTVSGVVLTDKLTEIRYTHQNTSTALVYNYFFGRWDYFTNHQADSSALWNQKLVTAKNTGIIKVENDFFYDVQNGSQSYSMYVETPWLKLKGIQDFQRIYTLDFLGEYLSPHTVTVVVSYDYDNDPLNATSYAFNSADVIGNPPISGRGGSVYQFQVGLEQQKCEAIKIAFTETPGTGSQASLYLNNLSAFVGLKKGLTKLPPEKSV